MSTSNVALLRRFCSFCCNEKETIKLLIFD
jgi:hypothetical protein